MIEVAADFFVELGFLDGDAALAPYGFGQRQIVGPDFFRFTAGKL